MAGDLRRYRAHYDVTVMTIFTYANTIPQKHKFDLFMLFSMDHISLLNGRQRPSNYWLLIKLLLGYQKLNVIEDM